MKWTNVHVILYEGEIQIRNKPKRKMMRVILRTILHVDNDPQHPERFTVYAPSFAFCFQCRHQVAAMDWVKSIRSQIAVKQRTFIQLIFSPNDPPKSSDASISPHDTGLSLDPQHHCYIYTGKKLLKNIWVGLISENSAKVKRKKKIKVATFIIGRSASCNLRLKDPFSSRSHCKIVIFNNVPYICDMGQSSKGSIYLNPFLTLQGTILNGKQITHCPLSPGDIITVGHTNLLFGITKKIKFTYAKPLEVPTTSPGTKRAIKKSETNLKK